MGAAATPAASFLSFGSMAAQGAGSLLAGAGTKAADEYRAAELQRAAQYGELKATQTAGQLTRNLNFQLGNIDAIRAAARTDPTSPTGAAYRGYQEEVGVQERGIETSSIMAQARQNEADAAYMRWAGSQALLAGDIGAGADILKGLRGLLGRSGDIPEPAAPAGPDPALLAALLERNQ